MDQFLQNTINGIQLGSIYVLIALGYTMVYGVLRLINFAHSDVFMVGAYVGYFASRWLKVKQQVTLLGGLVQLLPVLLISMTVCVALGLLIERLAYRPLRRAPRLTALITAIGISLFLEGAAQLPFVFGVDPKFYPEILPSGPEATLHVGQNLTISQNQLVLVITAFVLMAILWFIVQRTKMGKAMRAVSHDFDAAALMGINTDAVISFTFGLGAALAAAGGVLFGALTFKSILPLMGVQMGIKAFVAAVVGGIGSIPGAMLGGLLMGLSESFVKGAPHVKIGSYDFDPSRWVDALAFVILIVVLLVRPAGLLGKNTPEKV
ncbi:MAG: branched-chain amino acid ABC transporter permease [Armatimonadetes bacterium]|jgi:branched-chain amino acid transport system permease protein|nr:branched-chain amino acid ABC transporter permease [Armatimonadota bacterium]